MDDLTMVRELYGEPDPPSPQLAARIRGTLTDGGRRRSRRFVLGLGGGGLVAVGAAAAVAIAATGQGSTVRHPHKQSLPPSQAAAGPVQLAADKAEVLPTGKYWYSDQVEAQTYLVKAPTGDYAVSATGSEYFHWIAAKKGGGDVFSGRDLAFRPLTEQDRAAWQRAGSPQTLKVWAGDHFDTIVSKHGGWESGRAGQGGTFTIPGIGDGKDLTVADLQRLPADPDTLAKILLEAQPSLFLRKAGAKPGNSETEAYLKQRAAVPAVRLGTAGRLLGASPLPPKVQAAVMRRLATEPGIRQIGEVTDPLGRKAVALAGADSGQVLDTITPGTVKTHYIGYGSEEQLLFDPQTGAYLGTQTILTKPGGQYASRKPGFVIFYWVSRGLGWTDTKPAPPAKAPF